MEEKGGCSNNGAGTTERPHADDGGRFLPRTMYRDELKIDHKPKHKTKNYKRS